MYCVKCGVALGDTEKQCPLCNTPVYHPDILRQEAEPLYPHDSMPPKQPHPWGVLLIVSLLFLLPMSICLAADLNINGPMNWSGYVIGVLLMVYVMLVLPFWFRKRSPVVFVPAAFGAIGLYLWYINYAVNGDWFLRFAFPVTGYVGLVVTAFVVLMKYLRRGRLYIVGGAFVALGVFMPLLEFLIWLTFSPGQFGVWFMYPMIVLVLLGGMFIFLAICRPARETMERKFFV